MAAFNRHHFAILLISIFLANLSILIAQNTRKGELYDWKMSQRVYTIEQYEKFLRKYPNSRFTKKASFNIGVLKIVINKIPSCLVYDSSFVRIIYDPSNEFIDLTYRNRKWLTDTTNLDEFKYGKIFIVGMVNANTEIPRNARWGKGDLAPIFRTPRKDSIFCQEVSRCQRTRVVDLTHNLSTMLFD
jgi:hypothetical protein